MSVNVPSSQWRGKTEGGIPVLVTGRSGEFGEEDASATETFIIDAENLGAFALESFPLPYVMFGTVFYPRPRWMTSLPALRTKRVRWKGLTDGKPVDPFGNDPDAPTATYERFIEVTIEYGTSPTNDDEADPNDPRTFLEITANASGEFLNSPVRGSMFWDFATKGAGGEEVKQVDVPHTITESLTEWTARWRQIPHQFFTGTLLTRLRDSMGKVNQGVMSLFYNAPAETIMFLGYSMRYQYTWRSGYTGQSPVELELKFLEKNFMGDRGTSLFVPGGEVQVTHNHIYQPGVGWCRLYVGGNPLYKTTNLDQIFKT